MVGDSTDLHPVMAVSDKYERQEVVNRDGQRVMCNKVRGAGMMGACRAACCLALARQPFSCKLQYVDGSARPARR